MQDSRTARARDHGLVEEHLDRPEAVHDQDVLARVAGMDEHLLVLFPPLVHRVPVEGDEVRERREMGIGVEIGPCAVLYRLGPG